MPPDVAAIAAVKEELNKRITGLRIDKVQQPHSDMIILTLRGKKENALKLLVSVRVGDTRVHLTEHIFENPSVPPMFCMLLRKYLTGAKIEAVSQPPSERMLNFTLKTSNVMGDASIKHLIIELFGRIPNIILTDDDNTIIDCLRRISGDINGNSPAGGKRIILPGLKYIMPEQNKADSTNAVSVNVPVEGISKILDEMYTRRSKDENIRRRSAELTKVLNNSIKRISRKLDAQRSELLNTDTREYLRQSADIIMANLHRIKKGDELLTADDFYAGDGTVREIVLDPLLSAQKNAAGYYKKYTKARNAAKHLLKQITYGETELVYLESILDQLSRAESEQEISDIRGELEQVRYLNLKAKKTVKMKNVQSKPLQFTASNGMQILAGKNNTQNDKLTLKTAAKSDIWLHAQKIHGSHVIIKTEGRIADDDVLREAAGIAAYYCAARTAGKVPVDYTYVKNVKKPPGARPGMVTYTEFKTITAIPDGKLVEQLKTEVAAVKTVFQEEK